MTSEPQAWTQPIPAGYPTVSPYLIVEGAAKFIDFMVGVFGATVERQIMQPNGSIGHTELRLGDSLVMLADAHAPGGGQPVMLHIYVEDVDAVFERVIAAGAEVISPLANQFYGDRSGAIKEPAGNTIWIATRVEDVSTEEMQRRAAARAAGK